MGECGWAKTQVRGGWKWRVVEGWGGLLWISLADGSYIIGVVWQFFFFSVVNSKFSVKVGEST